MGKKAILEIKKDGLLFAGKPFYLASGEMHYFRFFQGGWKRRLQLMKDFGLTAVQTYVPWNLHEPEEGEYHFEDNLNLAAFLELCDEVGLKVLLRPSAYMCAEWEFGGLPYWLLKKQNICLRSSDPQFTECSKRYYKRLAEEFVPYLSTNGGPIIAFAIENEYGSYGDDETYIQDLGNFFTGLGVDVPMFTANGYEHLKMKNGSRYEYWTGLDLSSLHTEALANIREYQKDKPLLIPEFWVGAIQQWGVSFQSPSAQEIAEAYRFMLHQGAYVNMYMFCGGTNYGFSSGAIVFVRPGEGADSPFRFIPNTTSYDYDAPVSESGDPTEKYFACKKVLAEYLEEIGVENTGKETVNYEPVRQSVEDVPLTECTGLVENLQTLQSNQVHSSRTLTFETLNQDYGFVLYSSFIRCTDNWTRKLTITGLHDCAYVYGNGKFLGTYMRDREDDPILFTIPEEGMKLDILVENMGRARNGCYMHEEFKGICGYVKLDIVNEDGSTYLYNWTMKMGWTHHCLPLKSLAGLDYHKGCSYGPAFYRGHFSAKPGIDTFVDPSGFTKGMIWINGFNLGRYWKVGPQGTLYVPGELLKEDNTIEVFELFPTPGAKSIFFKDKPVLNTIGAFDSTDALFNDCYV